MAAHDFLMKLIRERFSQGEKFTLDEADELFGDKIKNEYPDNNHIREKIRQTLQQLRDRHFIEFIDNRGSYQVIGATSSDPFVKVSNRPSHIPPEELDESDMDSGQSFVEGAKTKITVNSYERDRRARIACIEHHKCICKACGFDFEKKYGAVGTGHIHVHHVVPLSTVGKAYKVDHVNDLIPVCANCHAIIHRKRIPYTIDEVKEMIAKQGLA